MFVVYKGICVYILLFKINYYHPYMTPRLIRIILLVLKMSLNNNYIDF